MNEWPALRVVALIVVWLTVAGGITLAVTWLRHGGARAVGPESGIVSEAAAADRAKIVTSFSSAQVGIHGLLGLLTAALATYALLRADDRGGGYVAVLGAILVTAIPGTLMYLKWHRGARPRVRRTGVGSAERVEDHLPAIVVFGHGLMALTFLVLVAGLLLVD
jgi:hypothetical protein